MQNLSFNPLHCILVDSSNVVCSASTFVILGMSSDLDLQCLPMTF